MSDFSAYDLTDGDTPFASGDPRTWPAGWNAFTDALEAALDGKADDGHSHVDTALVERFERLTVPGELTTGVKGTGIEWPFDVEITQVQIRVGTAPTGAAVIVDVNEGSTTIFTTQANRPEIAISGTESSWEVPDSGAAAVITAGNTLNVEVDQVGSTLPGEDMVVTIGWIEAVA